MKKGLIFFVKNVCLLLFISLSSQVVGQTDSLKRKPTVHSDFRFRIEQDWNSKKGNGQLRDDRSRLRLRARVGVKYQINEYAETGIRIRTGNLNDQQGPHLTIGNNSKFGLYSLGFEKAYLNLTFKNSLLELGKFDFPFQKQDELFWNDNVFPEGISFKHFMHLGPLFPEVQLSLGHFIINSQNSSFSKDSYFQGVQLNLNSRYHTKTYFSLYSFQNLSLIPDQDTQQVSYLIFNIGSSVRLLKSPLLTLGFDYYQNFNDYDSNEHIPTTLKNEKTGISLSLKYGQLKQAGDYMCHIYLTSLEKYAIVDYFAQNDWARWDYSSYNAFGSRLSNFEGMEIRIGYAVDQKLHLILRSYFVRQLRKEDLFLETGSRIRLDFDVKF